MAALDHHAALARLRNRRGASAAGPVQREPAPAFFKPPAHELVLLIVKIGASDITDQATAPRQPFRHVAEIIADGGQHPGRLLKQLQNPQARVIHIVSRGRARRKTTGDDMNSNGLCLSHRLHPPAFSSVYPFGSPSTRSPMMLC